jgi:hypothetical protein
MTTLRRRAALLPMAALLFSACAGAVPASPSRSPAASLPPSAAATTDPNASNGTEAPPSDPGIGNGDPGLIDPAGRRLVVPKPGQLDIHPISAEALTAVLDGRRVVVTIAYTSGVEPCSVLDSIVVDRGDKSFAMTLREGHGPGDAVCIEIAEMKRVQVDFGELEPGTYTISDATGGAAPIEVLVPPT